MHDVMFSRIITKCASFECVSHLFMDTDDGASLHNKVLLACYLYTHYVVDLICFSSVTFYSTSNIAHVRGTGDDADHLSYLLAAFKTQRGKTSTKAII